MPSTKLYARFHLVLIYAIGILCGIYLQPGLLTSVSYFNRNFNADSSKNFVGNMISSLAEDEKHHLLKSLDQFRDGHQHHDDDTKAKEIFSKVKVLVWVMTMKQNHNTKAVTVKNTWGKHCNKLLFMSDAEDKELPALAVYTETGRAHLTGKTMAAFDYIYEHHLDEYDWFMKADDDTYVVMENLRYMLSDENPESPIFFGQHFSPIVKQGYFSGGGGYVISKEALRRFGKRNATLCASDGGAEDVQFGRCMESLGVVTSDSRDILNRTRFHCLNPGAHLHGDYPDWYYKYDRYGGTKGPESISDYAVTFHYVGPRDMVKIEFFLYHLRPYGISSGPQDLNKHKHL